MNCRQFKKWMKKDPETWYLDVKHALEEHQQTCDSCRILWDHMQSFEETIRACRNLEIPENVDTSLWPGVFSRITPSPAKARKTFRPRFKPVLVWSISTVAAFCLLWMLVSTRQHFESTPDLIVDAATINGRDAQVMTFQFDDPKLSVIWME